MRERDVHAHEHELLTQPAPPCSARAEVARAHGRALRPRARRQARRVPAGRAVHVVIFDDGAHARPKPPAETPSFRPRGPSGRLAGSERVGRPDAPSLPRCAASPSRPTANAGSDDRAQPRVARGAPRTTALLRESRFRAARCRSPCAPRAATSTRERPPQSASKKIATAKPLARWRGALISPWSSPPRAARSARSRSRTHRRATR